MLRNATRELAGRPERFGRLIGIAIFAATLASCAAPGPSDSRDAKEPQELVFPPPPETPRFFFERVTVKAEATLASPERRFSMITAVAGAGELSAGGLSERVRPGDSLLVPAAVGEVLVRPAGQLEMLRFYVA